LVAICLIWAAGTACGPHTQPVHHHPAQQKTFGGDRPVTISVPDEYDNNKPSPLVVVLHGYSASGLLETDYLGFDVLVDEANVIVAAPDGTVDSFGNRFWNATDACCNFDHSTVDDVGYISSLITDISAEWNVDQNRVYLMGHSNGAFMAYRMACDRADLLAGIVALAGDTWEDGSRCRPSEKVSVLDIQGDADETISATGGAIEGVTYPGAAQSVAMWAGYDHCSGMLVPGGPNLDLDMSLPGAETSDQIFSGCPSGSGLELWTIHGGMHLPNFYPTFHTTAWGWMNAHPRK
jgi:polyhydroxybutyrate depolymerase